MKRILITRPLPERVIARAEQHFDVELREDAPMKLGQMKGAMVLFDAILPTLGDMFSAEVFAEFDNPRCKLLANFGVGYNHIDVAAARRAGVAVTNTPGAVTDATADIAMTLMLMSARRAGEGERLVRAGKWTGWTPTQMLGMHLSGKHVGIIGMGRIGQAIARRCHYGFGMQVSYYNRSPKSVDMPATQVATITDLCSQVDVVVLAVPSGPETHHLIDANVLAAMQPHAHFINIARGDIVDEAALIAALRAGTIAGAGLDVYEFEPAVPAELRAMENVVTLPHLGTAALEVRENMGMMALDNLIAFFDGKTPPNLL